MCRAADNVLRVRTLSGKQVLVGKKEPLGGGGDYWEVKDRFNAPNINGGFLPFDYQELKKKIEPTGLWLPAYIWIIYGAFGAGKASGAPSSSTAAASISTHRVSRRAGNTRGLAALRELPGDGRGVGSFAAMRGARRAVWGRVLASTDRSRVGSGIRFAAAG